MQKKKEKILNKIVKKNFNNELEHVLENKSFDENTKNLLLSILYKLEASYNDYEQVKQNVMPKDEFLQMIIDIIRRKIDTIQIVKINSKEAKILNGKSFLIDKENKKIICYPIERKLLYSILKISKKDLIVKDKYYVLSKTISDLLNTGSNINLNEAMRDFNGFSWSVITKDIESIEHNLIYQNLRMIAGAEFLNKWIYNKEFIIDYFDMFKSKLEDLYGSKMQEKLVEDISKLSVLLEVKYVPEQFSILKESKDEVKEKLNEINNKEEFIKSMTSQKKKLNQQIKKLDTTISDKSLLQLEYEKRNEKLPLEKKIFSMRVLAKIMKEERQDLVIKRQNINKMLNPQKFVKYKKELEDKYKYLQYIDDTNVENKIIAELLNFQNEFLECYKTRIKKAKTKAEITKLLVEFRYYLSIPFSRNKKIKQVNQLNVRIEEIAKLLINKAVDQKVLINILNNKDINYLVLKELFYTNIIKLQDININFSKENNRLYLQMFDENVFDERIDLGDLAEFNLNEFSIKLNKNVKLFIS